MTLPISRGEQLRAERLQAQVDALPPIPLDSVTFVITAFEHAPNDLLPTGYKIGVQATVTSTGVTSNLEQTVPLSVVDQIASAQKKPRDQVTQSDIVQWLWEQPETQLRVRRMALEYHDVQARVAARGGPAVLPSGDLTGKPFVPRP